MRKRSPGSLEELARILTCPVCEGRIRIDGSSENRLGCVRCDERFTVADGIPIMVPEKARRVSHELIRLYSSQPVRTEKLEYAGYIRQHVAYIKTRVSLDNKAVVDLGGAEGMLGLHLTEAQRVIVADISLPRLRHGASRGMANTSLVCGDIQTPFLNVEADVVLMMSVLEHVPSPQDVLKNAVRLLRPGGVLVLLVPVCNLPLSRLAVWSFRKIKGIDLARARKEHLRVYSTDSLAAQIQEAGLELEDVKYVSVLGELGAPKRVAEFGGRIGILDKLLASGIYLLARKPWGASRG
jgi:2-polyprenyl-3-methyl-5-hydroxy-6-metoxy-1,4-benzoquinol methylase